VRPGLRSLSPGHTTTPVQGIASLIDIHPDVAAALQAKQPVVALESTLIAHGLPWPLNLETAQAAEAAVRGEGVVPATIGVWHGRLTVGLTQDQLEGMAQGKDILKASRRDLAVAVTQRLTAATTVAATMFLAHQAGIRVFATGGIGGAHRSSAHAWDISADLLELSHTPVAVVCAGAKSILDIPRTLEILETQSVPVVGYQTSEFPAFHIRSSGEPVSARVDTPQQAAELCAAHWRLSGAGLVLAQAVAPELALEEAQFEAAMQEAESRAAAKGVRGKALTPFLLTTLAELTEEKSLQANQALVIANARLAAQIAGVLMNLAL
jgi:pseudouridine-5'-phosphate glycosidase